MAREGLDDPLLFRRNIIPLPDLPCAHCRRSRTRLEIIADVSPFSFLALILGGSLDSVAAMEAQLEGGIYGEVTVLKKVACLGQGR